MRHIRKYVYYLNSIFLMIRGFEVSLVMLWGVIIYSITKVTGNFDIPLALWISSRKMSKEQFTIRLRGSGNSFYARGAMDVWSIKETFLNRFYERHGFVTQPGWTVIDVGAGLGDFTVFAARVVGTHVLAFEPFPDSFDLLRKNLTLNKVSNVDAFLQAVSSTEGTLLLDLAGSEPLQFQSRNAPVTQPESQIEVKSRALSDIILQTRQGTCDLLKLDWEGAEYDILMNSSPEILTKIQRIVMEYHDGPTEYSHHDLITFLQSQGFKVQAFPNPVHANLGYIRAER